MREINILHLCLQAPYNDYWGYQDNLLPKYQRKMGHDVTVITTNTRHGEHGKLEVVEEADYRLSDGQRVIRLDYMHFRPRKIAMAFRLFKIYRLLCEIEPDFIMVHGLGNLSVLQVVRYLKKVKGNCTVVADNHLDYNMGKIGTSLTNRAYRMIFKLFNKYMQRFYSKVYGTTPWRVEYCEDVFGIAPSKTDVLVMGADDEKVDYENKDYIRKKVREKYGIEDNDLLVVTGGKIDRKKNIDLLMKGIKECKQKEIKLIVFGNTDGEMEKEINELAKSENIVYIGWIDADTVYDYFFAADLIVFPGQHSVLWEQACACGTPCVFQYWRGMDHVDVGGNCLFVENVTADNLRTLIEELYLNPEKLGEMKRVAEKEHDKFFYGEIAKKIIL